MEMRLRAPVTWVYFFLLGALRLVNAASPSIRSDEGLALDTSAFESLYGGQFTSTQLIKQKYL